jgi:hypothetical protein
MINGIATLCTCLLISSIIGAIVPLAVDKPQACTWSFCTVIFATVCFQLVFKPYLFSSTILVFGTNCTAGCLCFMFINNLPFDSFKTLASETSFHERLERSREYAISCSKFGMIIGLCLSTIVEVLC